jgi:hypothetical protein
MQPPDNFLRVDTRARPELHDATGLREICHVQHVSNGPSARRQNRSDLSGIGQKGTEKADSLVYVSFHAKSPASGKKPSKGASFRPKKARS